MIIDLVERMRARDQRRRLERLERMSLKGCARVLRMLERMQGAGCLAEGGPLVMARLHERLVEAGMRQRVATVKGSRWRAGFGAK